MEGDNSLAFLSGGHEDVMDWSKLQDRKQFQLVAVEMHTMHSCHQHATLESWRGRG